MSNTLTKAEPVDYNHIWLYAKHHYVRSKNIIKDLGIILGKRCGLEPEYFDRHPNEVLGQLTDLAWDALHRSGNPSMFFAELIKNASPEENWKVGGKHTHSIFGYRIKGRRSESYQLRTIRAILSLLSLTQCYEKGETLLELGYANPSILRLTPYAQRRWDERDKVQDPARLP